jgi:hypothetical protein
MALDTLTDYGIPLTREDKTNLLHTEFVDPQSGIAKVLSEWKIQCRTLTATTPTSMPSMPQHVKNDTRAS